METINHEYYVSLEVAKLLKEAGFDWEEHYPRNFCYVNDNTELFDKSVLKNYTEEDDVIYLAPTLDIAQRWLREVKNIDVVVLRAMQWIQFYYTIEHEENRTSKVDFMSLNEDLWWFKYEEAQEVGIKKALKLILEKGK